MNITIILTWIVGSLGAFFCWLHNRRLRYWKKIGIPHVKPVPVFGNIWSTIFGIHSLTDQLLNLYNKPLPGEPKYFGFYDSNQPVLMIKDPVLVRNVMMNSACFTMPNSFCEGHSKKLFNRIALMLAGDEWKEMREIMMPAFTPSYLRQFYELMEKSAKEFAECFETLDTTNVNMKDAFSKYTVDVTAITIFGGSLNSLVDKNEILLMTLKCWNEVGEDNSLSTLKMSFISTFPWLTNKMRLSITPKECPDFYRYLTRTTIRTREERCINRGDLLGLLMTAQDKETGAHELNVEDITAQAFMFFFMGLPETLSMSFMAYDIANNLEVQEELQREIDLVMRENDGQVGYEALCDMKYLEMVICESLRMHPPIPFTERICSKPYTLPPPCSDARPYTVPTGMVLWIPINAIQNDRQYFPDPDRFQPNRFSDENIRNIVPFTYFPWGAGAKQCYASEYTKLKMKLIFVHLLARFNFILTPEMKREDAMKYSRNHILAEPKNGFRLHLERRTATV